jgi:hypothetical protein
MADLWITPRIYSLAMVWGAPWRARIEEEWR